MTRISFLATTALVVACSAQRPPAALADRSAHDTPATRALALEQALPGAQLEIAEQVDDATAARVAEAFRRADERIGVDDQHPGCLAVAVEQLQRDVARIAPAASTHVLDAIVRRARVLGCAP